MKPIIFQCTQLIPKTGTEICTEMLDLSRWSDFKGYAFLPGIKSAVFEKKTADKLGTRIRVVNADGTEHVEEIYKWIEGEEVAMKMYEFTPPLSKLSTHFLEEWTLRKENNSTLVTRKFKIFPHHIFARLALWFISIFLKKAIARHLEEMAAA